MKCKLCDFELVKDGFYSACKGCECYFARYDFSRYDYANHSNIAAYENIRFKEFQVQISNYFTKTYSIVNCDIYLDSTNFLSNEKFFKILDYKNLDILYNKIQMYGVFS